MEPDRSEFVAARVVAWHNRHPLARRIRPEQVHSIGVVSLPFAFDGASDLPVLDEPLPAAEPVPAEPETAAAPAAPAELDTASHADPPTMPEVVIDDFDDDEAVAAAETPPADVPASADAEPAISDPAPATDEPATVTLVAEPAAAPALAEPDPAAAAAGGADTAELVPARWHSLLPPARDPRADPAPPAWHPRRWWPRGRAAVRSLFSEDFIEPLSPRRVARWVAAHGSFKRPLGADAPERQVQLDAERLAADGAAGPVALHVLTAAIGADGRRVRLLISPAPQGPILGPRQWDRRRVGAAGAGLALAFGAALSPRYWPLPEPSQTLAQAPAASAVAPPAAPATPASAPVDGHEVAHALAAERASAPASAAEAAVANASTVSTSAPSTEHEPAAAPAEPAHSGAPSSHAGTPAPAASVPGRPVDVEPRLGRIDLPPIIANLPRESRNAAVKPPSVLPEPPRVAATHRAEAPEPAAKAPADGGHRYALVMRATRTRAESEALAWQLRQHAGAAAGSSRADLLQTGDRWRAILFPFADAQRAEKVRQALVARGLAVEMVEF